MNWIRNHLPSSTSDMATNGGGSESPTSEAVAAVSSDSSGGGPTIRIKQEEVVSKTSPPIITASSPENVVHAPPVVHTPVARVVAATPITSTAPDATAVSSSTVTPPSSAPSSTCHKCQMELETGKKTRRGVRHDISCPKRGKKKPPRYKRDLAMLKDFNNPPNTDSSEEESSDDEEDDEDEDEETTTSASNSSTPKKEADLEEDVPKKRGPGRPPKSVASAKAKAEVAQKASQESDALAKCSQDMPKKRPGRPPKSNESAKAKTGDAGKKALATKSNELAWKCHICSRHNELSKLRCGMCKAYKGQSKFSTRTSTKGCEIVEGVERHGNECVLCGYGGEVICCDECDKVYHGNCIQVDDPSILPDPWHCPACDPDSFEDRKMPAKKISGDDKDDDDDDDGEEEEDDDEGKSPRSVSLKDAALAGCTKCQKEVATGEKSRERHRDSCPRKWTGPGSQVPKGSSYFLRRNITSTTFASAKAAFARQKAEVKQKDVDKEEEGQKKRAASKMARSKKEEAVEERGYDSDECYICSDGGELVLCDYCDKAFHKQCHLPPLLSIPAGKWRCCECSARFFCKRFKCGSCEACLRDDCGKCIYCLDKPKFGGASVLKQVCLLKQCPFKRYAPPATVTPEEKKRAVVKNDVETEEVVKSETDDESSDERSTQTSATRSNRGKRKHESSAVGGASNAAADRRSKRPHRPSLKPAEVAETASAEPIQAAAAAVGNDLKPAASNEARLKEEEQEAATMTNNAMNAPIPQQATMPASNVVAVGSSGDGNVPNDLVLCQMELKRALAENKRQADEIQRLKSAVKALTASLTG